MAVEEFGIVTRKLCKSFGTLVAVADLDLEVRRGEVFGLLGPNGSGKTTTIRMLTGLVRPTSGSAIVAGIDVVATPEKVRQRIGYMSQRFGFYEDLTIEENIRFYGGVYGLIGRERNERIAEQFARYRLGERSRQLAGTLSGGWKQRLALACATVHRPDLVFLDEPTAGVDPASRKLFWEMIREHADQGMTLIVTTHYMDEAERCDRLAFLSRGHLIGVGQNHRGLVQTLQHQFHPRRCRHRTQVLHGTPDQGGKVVAADGALTFLRLDPAQLQQIAHQTVHPFRFRRHHPQKAVARHRIIPRRPAQGFDEPQKRGQGRAQFMADIGHEITAHMARLFLIGNVLKQAQGPTANRRDGHLEHQILTGPLHGVAGNHAVTLRHDLANGRQNLGLAQDNAVVPPHNCRAEQGARRLVGPGDPLIRPDEQGGQRQSLQYFGHIIGRQDRILSDRPGLS